MMYTLVLLGIYYLLVAVIYGAIRVRPGAAELMYLFVAVGLFSFVPAIAVGREMLLGTELWHILQMIPNWLSVALSVLLVIAIVPVRSWIWKNALERSADAARHFLEELPRRVMAIEAAQNRGEITIAEASKVKFDIQRDADRVAAIDGGGRLLYLLLKLHLVRIVLQMIGAVAIGVLSERGLGWHTLNTCLLMIIIDGALILGPFLLLVRSILLVKPNSTPIPEPPFQQTNHSCLPR